MPKDLFSFFNPKSIAIIGASRTAQKVGSIVLKNLIDGGYKGKIYPVNPNVSELNNLPCYSKISQLPEVPELAIISLPSELALNILPEISAFGIKNVVMYASGFKEIGAEGLKLEQRLLEIIAKEKLNLLGPNCLGFVNNNLNLNATFGGSSKEVGKIKFISQSGAIAASIFDWSQSIGLGFSEFITIGNKTDLSEIDILNYFQKQAENEGAYSNFPIGMYLESITEGKEFIKICSNLAKNHPIFILKPGKSEEAASAMKSHTGSLAGSDDVLETALQKAGVMRCETIEDFFIATQTFSWLPYDKSQNVSIISNAGGPGVLATDSIILNNLNVVGNPHDLLGDALASKYLEAGEKLAQDKVSDSFLYLLTPQTMTEVDKTAEVIADFFTKYKKPTVASFIGGGVVASGIKILRQHKIPVFMYPNQAIQALSYLNQFINHQNLIKELANHEQNSAPLDSNDESVRGIIQHALNEKSLTIDNISSDLIIKSLGIKTPDSIYADNFESALKFAQDKNLQVVLKLSGSGLLHKKDLGGVITEISTEVGLKNSFESLQKRISEIGSSYKDLKIQIQQKIKGGIEVIVGIKSDPVFGQILLFGAGGSLVELISDKNIAILPLNITEAKNLISNSKIFKIFEKNNISVGKLAETLVHFSKLQYVLPEASDIEINPLIIKDSEIWAVDTKIVLKPISQVSVSSSKPIFLKAYTLENLVLASKFRHIKLETLKPFEFIPGQYISVKVASGTIRAYSAATRSDSKHFDLLVDTRPGGPGSLFFENLKKGDPVEFLGPFGKFTLNLNDGSKDLLFMATGSGASAVRCLIDSVLNELKTDRKVKLYFGLSHETEIFWKEHWDELKSKFKNFDYEISVSEPSSTWSGNKGFVTEIIKKDYPNASEISAYLCGHRNMIADVTDLLLEYGCPENRIYTERFV